jgi:hypothetical protein
MKKNTIIEIDLLGTIIKTAVLDAYGVNDNDIVFLCYAQNRLFNIIEQNDTHLDYDSEEEYKVIHSVKYCLENTVCEYCTMPEIEEQINASTPVERIILGITR